jgi:predicted membrane protein
MENRSRFHRKHHRSGKITLAFLLIAVGVILLGVNTGWIPAEYKRIFISWQMLLIVLGVAKFLKRQYFGGAVLLIVGGFFIMPVINRVNPDFFNFIPADFVQLYWPVFLIILGGFLFLRWLFPNSGLLGSGWRRDHDMFQHHSTTTDGNVHIDNLFGGSEQIVLDPEFKGGEINSVFGGTKLDLRRTNLPEGTTTLEVNLVFGGAEILIPSHWNVQLKIDTILGGFEDKRYGNESIDTSRKLLIKGSCVFGGGELKN